MASFVAVVGRCLLCNVARGCCLLLLRCALFVAVRYVIVLLVVNLCLLGLACCSVCNVRCLLLVVVQLNAVLVFDARRGVLFVVV